MKLCFAAISMLCENEVRVKPELKSPAYSELPTVPPDAVNGDNEKCTYSTLGAMNKKAPEKL